MRSDTLDLKVQRVLCGIAGALLCGWMFGRVVCSSMISRQSERISSMPEVAKGPILSRAASPEVSTGMSRTEFIASISQMGPISLGVQRQLCAYINGQEVDVADLWPRVLALSPTSNELIGKVGGQLFVQHCQIGRSDFPPKSLQSISERWRPWLIYAIVEDLGSDVAKHSATLESLATSGSERMALGGALTKVLQATERNTQSSSLAELVRKVLGTAFRPAHISTASAEVATDPQLALSHLLSGPSGLKDEEWREEAFSKLFRENPNLLLSQAGLLKNMGLEQSQAAMSSLLIWAGSRPNLVAQFLSNEDSSYLSSFITVTSKAFHAMAPGLAEEICRRVDLNALPSFQREMLILESAKSNPQLAAELASKFNLKERHALESTVLERLAYDDLEAASSTAARDSTLLEANPRVARLICQRLAGVSFDRAIEWAKMLPVAEVQKQAIAGAMEACTAVDARSAASHCISLAPDLVSPATAASIARSLVQLSSDEALEWVPKLAPHLRVPAAASIIDETEDPSLAFRVLNAIPPTASADVTGILKALDKIGSNLMATDPVAAWNWAVALPAQVGHEKLTDSIVAEWSATDPVGLSSWLISQPPSSHKDRAVSQLVREIPDDPERAMVWAASIADVTQRRQCLSSVFAPWHRSDRQSALTALRSVAPEDFSAIILSQ